MRSKRGRSWRICNVFANAVVNIHFCGYSRHCGYRVRHSFQRSQEKALCRKVDGRAIEGKGRGNKASACNGQRKSATKRLFRSGATNVVFGTNTARNCTRKPVGRGLFPKSAKKKQIIRDGQFLLQAVFSRDIPLQQPLHKAQQAVSEWVNASPTVFLHILGQFYSED